MFNPQLVIKKDIKIFAFHDKNKTTYDFMIQPFVTVINNFESNKLVSEISFKVIF